MYRGRWTLLVILLIACKTWPRQDPEIPGIKKGLGILPKPLNYMVPRAGVEPARPYSRGILSLKKPKIDKTSQQTIVI